MDSKKKLFATKDTSNSIIVESNGNRVANIKEVKESYHAWGVRWSGNAEGNRTALSPALQSCYTHNVSEQNKNLAIQQKIIIIFKRQLPLSKVNWKEKKCS